MIDCHVHLEKGPYAAKWLNEFVKQAQKMNIDEIYFLEHTHIFNECAALYNEMSIYNDYQQNWFNKKRLIARPIKDYINFIENIKKETFPIKLKFGLEVCYSPQHEEDISRLSAIYPFDFLVGSIHWIDGWAFSHLKQRWTEADVNVDTIYKRYYQLMEDLIKSRLFNGLAHPNSLSCFGAMPLKDFCSTYKLLADLLVKNSMYIEESSGLVITYGAAQLGMNKEMLKIMKEKKVNILTASDAHLPQYVGAYVKEMNKLINE